MIKVTLDEEMIKLFESKVWPGGRGGKFTLGESLVDAGGNGDWKYEKSKVVVFKNGPEGTLQYDDEFTEWLKEYRPELFL